MYEISFILKTEDASLLQRVFSRHGAETQEGAPLKKIRLAYPIKKSEYGFLGSFKFEVKPESLEKISSDLKLEEDLLRYMVTKPAERVTSVRSEGKTPPAVSVGRKTDEPKRHADQGLTNEELEKKIEEILQ